MTRIPALRSWEFLHLRQNHDSSFFKTAEHRAVFVLAKTLHDFETGAAQQLHWIFDRRLMPVEIQEAAAGPNQRVGIFVDATDNVRAIGVVNRDRRDDSSERAGHQLAPAVPAEIRDDVGKTAFVFPHALTAKL